MQKFSFILVFVFALLLTGCGGGGGGGNAVPINTEADQALTAQLIGTWKLSQATKIDKLVPVKPNTAGQVGTITFNSGGTANSVDYVLSTSNITGPVIGPVVAPVNNDFWQTSDNPPDVSAGSWTASGGKLYSTAADGKVYVNSVEIRNGELYQIMPDNDTRVWVR